MISSYAWVSGGELPSQRLRSYTFGLAASTGFLVSALSVREEWHSLLTDRRALGWQHSQPRMSFSRKIQALVALTLIFPLSRYFINPDALNWGPKYGCKSRAS
jgi:hypothetical protein